MGIYSIRDLAELTGVKTHTLRVWEKRYAFLKPQRTDTNIRYYLDSDLKVLMLVLNLYHHGFRISRISEMTPEEMEAESKRLSADTQDESARMKHAVGDMDVTVMSQILDQAIRSRGFESTLMTLILPLLEEMELMWLSGQIEEAHEVCFRELIRRKTIREIDTLPHHCEGPKVITLLPKGNQQELSHLFMHYFLRKQGLCVTDLGCGISQDCAVAGLNRSQADCLLLVNADPVHWQFGPFVKEILTRTTLPFIISGRASDEDWSPYAGRVVVLDTIEETIRFASQLQENLQNLIS